jgi:hypothetical protein
LHGVDVAVVDLLLSGLVLFLRRFHSILSALLAFSVLDTSAPDVAGTVGHSHQDTDTDPTANGRLEERDGQLEDTEHCAQLISPRWYALTVVS